MRRQAIKLSMLLLLSSQALFAGQQPAAPGPQLTRENIGKATQVLRKPGVIKEKIAQGIENPALKAPGDTASTAGGDINKDGLKDPTWMNQNFREALERLAKNSARVTPSSTGTAPKRAALPKIALLASICGVHKNTNSAILRINDKTQMVRAGDKITIIDDNQIIEIQIMEILKHHVKITVFPFNETLIL